MTQRRRFALLALTAALAGCGGAGPVVTSPPLTPAPTAAPATAAAQRTPAPDPTPSVSLVDGVSVTTASLGVSVAPIDVVSAFGSIWVASHHRHTVLRLDPSTMETVATIEVGDGPGWFAVTDDALWVNSQMGHGLTRVDPGTNTAGVTAGEWPTCGGPAVAAGSIWQMACDAGQLMRIDPESGTSTDIAAPGFSGVGLVGDRLIATGPDGLYEVDTRKNRLTKLEIDDTGFPIGYDDVSVWLAGGDGVRRVAVDDGTALGTIKQYGETVLTMADGRDRAWLSIFGAVLFEVDTTTTSIVRTLRLHAPSVAREIDGEVWVTSFDANSVSRFSP